MAGIWDYEYAVSRRARRPFGLGWTHRAVFNDIASAAAVALIPAEHSDWLGVAPSPADVHAPVLVDSDALLDWRPGRALVTLFYRPLTADEWLGANPDHGILLGNVGAEAERVRLARSTTDTWGTLSVVEGPGTGGGSWKVIAGSNLITNYDYIAEIYAVIEDMATYYDPFVAMSGFYNSAPLTFMPAIGIKGSGISTGTAFATTVDKFTDAMVGEQIEIGEGTYRIEAYTSPQAITLDSDPSASGGADFEVIGREAITGTASSSGTTLTSTADKFYPPMVGSRIAIAGTNYIITGYTSSKVVTLSADPSATGAAFGVASSEVGKWRLIGLNKTPRPGASELYTCRYQFRINRRGWNQPTISEQFTVNPYQYGVLDGVTGDPVSNRYSNVYRPTRDTSSTKEFIFFEGGDFSDLADLLTDSWAA